MAVWRARSSSLGRRVLLARASSRSRFAPRLAHVRQQLRFLAGQRLLAVGLLRIGAFSGPDSAIWTHAAGHCQGQQEEPAVAHERDVRSLRAHRGRDSAPAVRVSSVRVPATVSNRAISPRARSTPAAAPVPLAGDRRRQPALVVGQPSQARRRRRRPARWRSRLRRGAATRSRGALASPDQRSPVGGYPTSAGPRMMLSTVSGNSARAIAVAGRRARHGRPWRSGRRARPAGRCKAVRWQARVA